MNIVIDSNILISALIREGKTREIIINSIEDNFLLPEFSLSEIEEHKDELILKSRLTREDFDILLDRLSRYIEIVKTESIIFFKKEARDIMGMIDPDDVMFIACALASPGSVIWSDDGHFKMQNRIKVYTTQEMIK